MISLVVTAFMTFDIGKLIRIHKENMEPIIMIFFVMENATGTQQESGAFSVTENINSFSCSLTIHLGLIAASN